MLSPSCAGRIFLPSTAARLALLAPSHIYYSTRPVPSPTATAANSHNGRFSAAGSIGDSAVRYRWILGDDVCVATRRLQQVSPTNNNLLAATDNPGDPAEPKGGGSGAPEKNLPTPEVLERAQQRVAKEFSEVFLMGPDVSLYTKDLVFENKISGRTTTTLGEYVAYMRLLKIYAHFRFAFVHCKVLGIHTSAEEGAIRVRWQFLGLGALRLATLYVPRQLWRKENFKGAASPWQDGVSTFYVGSDGLVKRHVVDNKEEDRGEVEESRLADSIKAKLAKLRKGSDVPAPAM